MQDVLEQDRLLPAAVGSTCGGVNENLECCDIAEKMPWGDRAGGVEKLMRAFGPTPALVMDTRVIRQRARRFKKALPEVRPLYAFKSNPHLVVASVLQEEGVGFEAASVGEIEALVKIGVAGESLYFSNPIKPASGISRAADLGVEWFSFDSEDELLKIHAIKPDAKLYLRVETDNTGSDWPLTRKFGASPEECEKIVLLAQKLGADVAGVTFHVGSQCRRPGNWKLGIENAMRIFGLMKEAGLFPRFLNLGGGYPVPMDKPVPSIEEIACVIRQALRLVPPEVTVVAEPGRYLVAEAGTLACRVVGTARRRGKRWVYLDAGVFGGLVEASEAFRYPIRTSRTGNLVPSSVAGPTCDSMDVIWEHCLLPEDLQEGDMVLMGSAGAYTTAYASTFNGFALPEVMFIR
mgnify:CR=1 FL=1